MGEILSTEQQLTETQRGLERLPRQRDSKDKNLQDQLQALGVQVQDAENEMVRERERGLESGWKTDRDRDGDTDGGRGRDKEYVCMVISRYIFEMHV